MLLAIFFAMTLGGALATAMVLKPEPRRVRVDRRGPWAERR